jgi:dTDP-4-dehydrorhamnose 3,5-epimerase
MKDQRGAFVKTFHREVFESLGLETRFDEQYFSVSRKNVVRGMHFQIPPADHNKLVFCCHGEVLDVLVDLRRNSRTYGLAASFSLTQDNGSVLYIPRGFAHGFLTLSDEAIMVYNCETVYRPELDTGILWSSLDFDWPVVEPILSDRDRGFPSLQTFESPFGEII